MTIAYGSEAEEAARVLEGQPSVARKRSPRWFNEQTVFLLLIAPAALALAIFYLYPLARVLWISVTEPSVGLANYARLSSPPVLAVASTTLRICVGTTVITIILAYIVSYTWVHSAARARRLMLIGILLPLWVSALVRAFSWITLLRREGLVNSALLSTGIIDTPLSMLWNDFGVMVGMVHYMLPYGILPLAANMRQIDPSLTAAARGLGATATQAFWRVYLPLSIPGLVASGVLVFIFSMGFYVTPALLGGGRTVMVTEYISIQIMEVLRWGLGTALATTLILIIAILLGSLSRMLDLRQVFGAK